MRSEHEEHHAHLEQDGDGVVPASALAPEPAAAEPGEGAPVQPERERLP